MKNIVIIPARGGSKRLPNKNIMLLGGIPLLIHSIAYAKKNQNIVDEIYVSTDDLLIKKIALEQGVLVIDRPVNIAGDLEPTITALQHVLESIEHEVANVIVLQPTNPLRPENLLKEAFAKFSNNQSSSLFTVSRNEHKLGDIVQDRFISMNYKAGQRSQDLDPLYFENGLLYICEAKQIVNGEIINEDSYPYLVNHIFSNVDIDTQDDFDYAEYLFQKFLKTH
ncbi:acylneuraminate cytidylyltransferase family protein [Flavobacterium sp. F-380]|uniref:Acylneuraminate cytidylyltransferase family protein n=1 Tax=Flavobacterium kayseriense TaxID=2764714 RepID=A0ABR7J7L0_9FLAO|nr:acylneuraminate cytidylyltransferase family protein [Flavobacterium kayseriense]MBC5841431.1 acylneuraminate cytidylyltransferase family protein [Flavobacterium kayseriense]MBC5847959.1 acylneuraminate cytidylyltransferase family protein [Flavobacterium kayseriense]